MDGSFDFNRAQSEMGGSQHGAEVAQATGNKSRDLTLAMYGAFCVGMAGAMEATEHLAPQLEEIAQPVGLIYKVGAVGCIAIGATRAISFLRKH